MAASMVDAKAERMADSSDNLKVVMRAAGLAVNSVVHSAVHWVVKWAWR